MKIVSLVKKFASQFRMGNTLTPLHVRMEKLQRLLSKDNKCHNFTLGTGFAIIWLQTSKEDNRASLTRVFTDQCSCYQPLATDIGFTVRRHIFGGWVGGWGVTTTVLFPGKGGNLESSVSGPLCSQLRGNLETWTAGKSSQPFQHF